MGSPEHSNIIAVWCGFSLTRRVQGDYSRKYLEAATVAYASSGLTAAAAAKLLQSCPTLCDPIDGSPPGSPVPGILQARTLEWVAISFSNAWKVKSESEAAQSCLAH